MKTVLIIGGNSTIGGAMAEMLPRTGTEVMTTTRRHGEVGQPTIHLDLDAPPEDWPDMPSFDAVLICASVTSLKACENDPTGTFRINVNALAALGERLVRKGSYILFLSTDRVFDGSKAFRPETDAPCPVTEYGRQKAMAEKRLLNLGDKCGVLRLGKVMGPAPEILVKWKKALSNGNPIDAIDDMSVAPLALSFVQGIIHGLLREKAGGIFQATGDKDLNYYTLAEMLAKSIDADRSLIRRVTAKEMGLSATAQSHTTLSTARLEKTLGIGAPSSVNTMQRILDRL